MKTLSSTEIFDLLGDKKGIFLAKIHAEVEKILPEPYVQTLRGTDFVQNYGVYLSFDEFHLCVNLEFGWDLRKSLLYGKIVTVDTFASLDEADLIRSAEELLIS